MQKLRIPALLVCNNFLLVKKNITDGKQFYLQSCQIVMAKKKDEITFWHCGIK